MENLSLILKHTALTALLLGCGTSLCASSLRMELNDYDK